MTGKIKKIKSKLFLAYISILTISAITTIFSLVTINTIRRHFSLIEDFDSVLKFQTDIKFYEKNFLLYEVKDQNFYEKKASQNLLAANERLQAALDKLDFLENQSVIGSTVLEGEIEEAKSILIEYQSLFKALVNTSLTKGYKDWGAVGEMRASIHAVENAEADYDRSFMLMLRRHEKDFLLRKDVKYLDKFKSGILNFKHHLDEQVNQGLASLESVNTLKDALDQYEGHFEQVVNYEEQIGFSSADGIMGDLNTKTVEIEGLIPLLNDNVKVKINTVIRNDTIFLIILFLIQIVVCVSFGMILSNRLSAKIIKAKDFIITMAKGQKPDGLVVKGRDEMAVTYEALNQLSDRVNTAAQFAEEVGKGNLGIAYSEDYKNGTLEDALIVMKDNLTRLKEEENQRQAHLSKLTELGDVIRQKYDNQEDFSYHVISHIVKMLGANQGGIFILSEEDDEPQLRLTGCYAFERRKYLDKCIRPGQGIVGQCLLEKEMTYIEEVPENYVYITSGLGNSNPRSIIVVPLMMEDQVYGVMELASFRKLTENDQDLIQKSADSIASVIRYTDFARLDVEKSTTR
ncbi:MAG: GAF domain-containing protein [Bacteroidota bacterium]